MTEAERLDNSVPSGDREPGFGADGDRPATTEREAYFQALRLWIQQAQMYQNLSSCFPYYMMSLQGMQPNQTNIPLLNNNYQFQGHQFPFQIPPVPPRPVPESQVPTPPLSPVEVIQRHGGFEYVIPQLYKRLLAEFIDFMLLFILKLIVTFIAVDMFDIISHCWSKPTIRTAKIKVLNLIMFVWHGFQIYDLDKFDLYKFSENYDDYKYAMELTSEILLLEIIYRILVCIYEAFCLSSSVGRMGGATPGKALLGLRVVTASAVIPVEGRPKETVLLYPGRPLTFAKALARSLLKNFLISLLFPLCVILFVFRFNRTGYDLLCGVIVVEENMFPPRRHAP